MTTPSDRNASDARDATDRSSSQDWDDVRHCLGRALRSINAQYLSDEVDKKVNQLESDLAAARALTRVSEL